jgi:hypothetical protein
VGSQQSFVETTGGKNESTWNWLLDTLQVDIERAQHGFEEQNLPNETTTEAFWQSTIPKT